jgi:hypothetical protein
MLLLLLLLSLPLSLSLTPFCWLSICQAPAKPSSPSPPCPRRGCEPKTSRPKTQLPLSVSLWGSILPKDSTTAGGKSGN